MQQLEAPTPLGLVQLVLLFGAGTRDAFLPMEPLAIGEQDAYEPNSDEEPHQAQE